MSSLTVEVFTRAAAFQALAPEWERLHAASSPRRPFTSPEWNAAWWRRFRRRWPWVADDLRLFVLRDAGSTLIGIVPMMLTCRPAFGPFRTRELQFLGADGGLTEIRGPVCRPEHALAVAQSLERHLAARGGWDWIQWRGLPRRDGTSDWLSRRTGTGHGTIDYYIALTTGWKPFLASRPRNLKEAVRKGYNSLARDNHAFTFRSVSDAGDIDAAAQVFFALHRDRAGLTGTVRHRDVFRSASARAFLVEVLCGLAARDGACIFQLLVGGGVVATRIAFPLGDELFLYYSGFDPEWGRYSVMTTLMSEIIKWAMTRGLRVVNLSTGTDRSKTRWRPEQIVFEGGDQVGRRARSRLAFSLIHHARNRKVAGLPLKGLARAWPMRRDRGGAGPGANVALDAPSGPDDPLGEGSGA